LIDTFATLVQPGDVGTLRGALEQLLADPDRRRELGADARKAAQRRLAPQAAAIALAGVYEEARG
jgi:glycosyltransferase involved in cell wall biosynthesis